MLILSRLRTSSFSSGCHRPLFSVGPVSFGRGASLFGRRKIIASGVTLAAILSLIGCGNTSSTEGTGGDGDNVSGSGGSGSGGGPPFGGSSTPTQQEFLAAFPELLCELSINCLSPKDFVTFDEMCHPAGAEALIDFGQTGRLIPEYEYDAQAAGACLGAWQRLAEDCAAPENLEEVCASVWNGRATEGDACAFESECAKGLWCDAAVLPSPTCAGVCVQKLAEGEMCEDDSHCESHLECLEGTCSKVANVGDICNEDAPCKSSAWCDESSGRCRSDADSAGKSCDPDAPFWDSCPAPFDCNADGVCERHGPRPGPGDTCSGGDCPELFSCVNQRCQALPVAGDPCSEASGCATGVCDGGTCRWLTSGDVCDPEPAGLRCEQGSCNYETEETARCEAYGGEGDTCGDDGDCAPELRCGFVSDEDDEGTCIRFDVCSK